MDDDGCFSGCAQDRGNSRRVHHLCKVRDVDPTFWLHTWIMEAVTCTLLGCVFLGITHPTHSSRVGGRLVKDFIEPGSLGVSHFSAAWQGARKNAQLHQLAELKCKESLRLRLRSNSSVSERHSQSDTENFEKMYRKIMSILIQPWRLILIT